MSFARLIALYLVFTTATRAWSHHDRGHYVENKEDDYVDRLKNSAFTARKAKDPFGSEVVTGKDRRSLNLDEMKRVSVPFNARRLEKMLEKAILKIITGDLSTADMLLLKSLNYSLEEVLAIRERELGRRKDEEFKKEEMLKSEKRTLYGENTIKKRNKHLSHNTMELDYSPRTGRYEDQTDDRKKNHFTQKSPYNKDFDFDAYNKQAVIDYENLASKLELQQSWSDPATLDYEDSGKVSKEEQSVESFHRHFDRAMEPHVVFKIRYDDSEFDSNSDERLKTIIGDQTASNNKTVKHHNPWTLRHTSTTSKNAGNFFHASPPSSPSSVPPHTPLPVVYRLGNFNTPRTDYSGNHEYAGMTKSFESTTAISATASATAFNRTDSSADVNENSMTGNNGEDSVEHRKESNASGARVSEYEGLEWVEDDVYRVIPAVADSLSYDNNDENETLDYEDASGSYQQNSSVFPENTENDTAEYQNDTPDPIKLFMANANLSSENLSLVNLSTYQQMALAHRRDQGQKAIEDIKSRILALTGRFNLSTNTNQVQRERLTMFSPTCQIPRNTDTEAWADPFSMNMYFQLNLTAGDHVVAAKLRIYKLPQENLTSSGGTFEEDEEDEKKIRISIYYYTKSLKRHRSKKRLMDSVVTSLTSDGTHLALDVRQGLKFWRLSPRNQHGNSSNHGLVIQVEDQDGRPLKPALYIQQLSCPNHDSDQKTNTYLHFSSEPVLVTFAS